MSALLARRRDVLLQQLRVLSGRHQCSHYGGSHFVAEQRTGRLLKLRHAGRTQLPRPCRRQDHRQDLRDRVRFQEPFTVQV